MQEFEERDATLKDTDEMTWVVFQAFQQDPQWIYRFPRWREFQEDAWVATWNHCKKILLQNDGDTYFVRLIKKVSADREQGEEEIVGVAVWEGPEVHSTPAADLKGIGNVPARSNATLDCILIEIDIEKAFRRCEFRHADRQRCEAFSTALAAFEQAHFDNEFGNQQMGLGILATLPRYQRQGIGTRMCQSGVEMARRSNRIITLMSSPQAEGIYTRLGFVHVGTLVVKMENDEQRLDMSAMVYDPR